MGMDMKKKKQVEGNGEMAQETKGCIFMQFSANTDRRDS